MPESASRFHRPARSVTVVTQSSQRFYDYDDLQASDVNVPAGSAVVAFVTTIHLALALLRQHRSVRRPAQLSLLLPSALLTLSPWFLPGALWLLAGIAAHLAWFVACEWLLPQAATAPPARAPSPSRRPDAQAPESSGRPAAPGPGFTPVPVLAVIEETPDIRTFRLRRPEGMRFLAGQFLTVRVNVDGKPLVRCYSISSAPESPGYVEISVKRQGVVSNLLHATLRPGSVIAVKGAAGQFRYPDGDDRPLVLIAGGVGITPVMSMLRHAISSDPSRPVTLLLSVRTENDIPFHDELLAIRSRHPQVQLGVRVSRSAAAPGITAGRIDETCIRRYVADPANSIFMMCGPLAMIDAIRSLLLGMGARADDVRAEAFEAAVAASRERAQDGLATVLPIQSGQRSAAPAHVTLALSQKTVAVGRGQSLLDACESAGSDIPSSCRAGVCLTCRTRLLEGEVDCASDSLDAEDRESGFILPCVSWPKGDCVLEA